MIRSNKRGRIKTETRLCTLYDRERGTLKARFPKHTSTFVQVGNFFGGVGSSADAIVDVLGYSYACITDDERRAGFNVCTKEVALDRLCAAGYIVSCVVQKPRTKAGSIERTFEPAYTVAFRRARPIAERVDPTTLALYNPTTGVLWEQTYEDEAATTVGLLQHEVVELLVKTPADAISARASSISEDRIVRVTSLTLKAYVELLCRPYRLQDTCASNNNVYIDPTTVSNLGLVKEIVTRLDPGCSANAKRVFTQRLRSPINDPERLASMHTRVWLYRNATTRDAAVAALPKRLTLSDPACPIWRPINDVERSAKRWVEARAEWMAWSRWTKGIGSTLGAPLLKPPPFQQVDIVIPPPSSATLALLSAARVSALVATGGDLKWATTASYENTLCADCDLIVPATWELIGVTKNFKRYDTPELRLARVALAEERCARAECQYIHLVACYEWLAERGREIRGQFHRLAELELELRVAASWQDICRPQLCETDSGSCVGITASNMHNGAQDCIKVRSFALPHGPTTIRGANGAGKSHFMRTISLNIVLAHCGLPVFASSFKTPYVDMIAMRFGSNDDLHMGRSSLDHELEHTMRILHRATNRSVAFVDEFGCCCDAVSGAILAQRAWDKLKTRGTIALFATHFELERVPEWWINPSTRQIVDHPCKSKDALHVAQECGISSNIINSARRFAEGK